MSSIAPVGNTFGNALEQGVSYLSELCKKISRFVQPALDKMGEAFNAALNFCNQHRDRVIPAAIVVGVGAAIGATYLIYRHCFAHAPAPAASSSHGASASASASASGASSGHGASAATTIPTNPAATATTTSHS